MVHAPLMPGRSRYRVELAEDIEPAPSLAKPRRGRRRLSEEERLEKVRREQWKERPHECQSSTCMRYGLVYQDGNLVSVAVPEDHMHCRCGIAIRRGAGECDLCHRQRAGEHLTDVEFERALIARMTGRAYS